jgi:hypothetical protein
MNRLLGWIAFAGFLLALLVHIATTTGVDVYSRLPSVWLLHLGAILVCGLLALSARKSFGSCLKLDEIMYHFRVWVVLVFAAVFLYAVLNVFLCLSFTGNGATAVLVDGQYVLRSHGRVLAQLTESEYHVHRAYELRFFSGVWLVFYLMPSLYFFFWREQLPVAWPDRR